MVYIKTCQHGECKSNTQYSHKEYMQGVTFFRFPNPKKNIHKFQRWIISCGLDLNDFNSMAKFHNVRSPKYVCSKHFVDGSEPSITNPDPLKLHGKVIMWNRRRKVVPLENNTPRATSSSPTSVDLKQTFDEKHISPKRVCSLLSNTLSEYQHTPEDTSGLDLYISTSKSSTTSSEDSPLLHSEILSPVKSEVVNVTTLPDENHQLKPFNSLSVNTTNITETEINLNFEDIREKIGAPFGWTTYYGDECAKYSIAQGDSLVLSYKVNREMTTTLTVFGRTVGDHNVLTSVKRHITSVNDIIDSLKHIELWKPCGGNSKDDFQILNGKFSVGKDEILSSTGLLYSKDCEMLIKKDGRIKRCGKCQHYRLSLRQARNRKRQCMLNTVKKSNNMKKREKYIVT